MSALLCLATSAHSSRESSILRLLLDRAEVSHITEAVLLGAAGNFSKGSNFMPLIIDRADLAAVTEFVVNKSLRNLELGAALQVLARSGKRIDTQDLLEAAAQNNSCGAELVRSLLERNGAIQFPERALINATENRRHGGEIILALEEIFGPVKIDEDRLCTLLRNGRACQPLEVLLKPHNITNKVLIAALDSYFEFGISPTVIENSSHLDITLEVLEVAAQRCPLDTFRRLWTRGRLNPIPESLLVAAAQNYASRYDIMNYLLEQANEVQAGERLAIAVAEKTFESVKLFALLLQRQIPVIITQQVLRTAVAVCSSGPCESSIEWLLEHNSDLEITKDLFEIAASNGREDILHLLKNQSSLENPPSEWVNVARVYNAARSGDVIGLKYLLDSGVEPDTSNPQGGTPLAIATQKGHETIVEMLLSAGASPDPVEDGRTPLCQCAYRNEFDLAKILVEAGASLDFKDQKGRTPELIAMESENLEIFKYLEQCREEKEGGAKATSLST